MCGIFTRSRVLQLGYNTTAHCLCQRPLSLFPLEKTSTTITKMTFTESLHVSSTVNPRRNEPPLRVKECLKTPSVPIFSVVENRLRYNPAHVYLDVNFVSHVRGHSYTLSTINFGSLTGASLLNDGLHDNLVGLLSRMPASISPCLPLEVLNTRAKGLGTFATSFIPPGSFIFGEHPVMLAPYLPGVSVPLADMYTKIFESLPKSSLALVSSLATLHQDDGRSKSASLSFYENVMKTNSVVINLLNPTDGPHPELLAHRALFLRLSRCNHSCDPNATWSWDAQTLRLTLSALHPILPQEEITISYIVPSKNQAALREELKISYGFDCICEKCTLPSHVTIVRACNVVLDNLAESIPITLGVCYAERAKTRYTPDFPTLEEWLEDATLPDAMLIDEHKTALHRIEQQKFALSYHKHLPLGICTQLIDQHVESIAMCYGALGDIVKFRKWVAIMKDANTHPEHKAVFTKWLSNPSSFPLWGKRKRKSMSAHRS